MLNSRHIKSSSAVLQTLHLRLKKGGIVSGTKKPSRYSSVSLFQAFSSNVDEDETGKVYRSHHSEPAWRPLTYQEQHSDIGLRA